jgi:hypothetical protein
MATCQNLANRYAQETGIQTPDAGAPINPDRADWLLTQTWACQYKDDDGKLVESTDPAICSSRVVSIPPTQNQNVTESTGVPRTILEESGFLDWVNQRGMGCINKVTGIVNTHPYGNGVPYTEPGLYVPYPKAKCASACYNVTAEQDTCFECVKNALEDPSNNMTTLCPALYNGDTIKSVDTGLMKESLGCHTCIAENSTNLTVATSTVASNGNVNLGAEYNPDGFNRIWGCITGNVSQPLSTGAIIGIIIGSLVLAAALAVGLYFLIKKELAKKKARTTADIKKIAAGGTPSKP